MSELTVEFGKQIRSLRQSRGMSQEELAFKAGLSPAHLGQIERAQKKPTLETIGRLADALKVSVVDLFSFDAPVPFPKKQTQNEAKKPNGSTSQVAAANRPAKHRGDTQPKAE